MIQGEFADSRDLEDPGIPVRMGEGFAWAMAQQNAGMIHWLGIDWQNHPMVIQRLLVGEVDELYSVLHVNKTGMSEDVADHQWEQLRLEAVDCFILTLTQFIKITDKLPTIYTPSLMAAILASCWDKAIATGQRMVTSRSDILNAIDHYAEYALSSSGDRALEGRTEPVMMAQFRLFIALGLDLPRVLKTFAAKRVLNQFRTNRSYNAGGYRKNWWWSPSGGAAYPTPDTIVADTLINRLDVHAAGFKSVLYDQFVEIYGD